MKAIILAAGVGKRLHTVAKGRPKCLIEVGDKTLLKRHLENLAFLGIKQIVMVVGYEHQVIREAVAASGYADHVHFVMNEQYRRGSITSLWRARQELNDDVVIMDADVLYDPHILQRLIESPLPNALLLDETVSQETEECMVAVLNNRVIKLSKVLPAKYDLAGEGVGFLKVSQMDCEQLVQSMRPSIDADQLDMEYEDALTGLFEQTVVGYERIGGLPWIEIDFPEDVERAEREVLPQLPPVSDGAVTSR